MRDSRGLYGLEPVHHFEDSQHDKEIEKRFCEYIAGAAAEAIVQAEMSAVLSRWKGLIVQHGLERVAEMYSGTTFKKGGDQDDV